MTADNHTRLMDLEKRLADAERRIAELERAPFSQWPRSWLQPIGNDPLPISDETCCATCGGRYKDMTHYVCSHPRCPSRITCGDVNPPSFT